MKTAIMNIAQGVINRGEINGVPKADAGMAENAIANTLSTVFGIFAAIAVLVISIGALKMVMSRGNPQEVSKARDTVIYATIGLAISMASYIIVDFVIGAI